MTRPALSAFALILCAVPAVARGSGPDIASELQAVQKRYESALKALQAELDAGRAQEAVAQFAASAGDEEKSPAELLFVGNVLYSLAPELSYKYHKSAYERLDGRPEAAIEWAMEQHRAGEFAGAATAYREYLQSPEGQSQFESLLADCLVHTGDAPAAAAAWKRANHASHHSSIQELIQQVYGKLHPLRRRGDLLRKVRAGDLAAAEELIDLDLHFDFDWWNVSVNESALRADRAELATLLAARPARLKALDIFVALSGGTGGSPRNAAAELTKDKLILGKEAALPESSLLAGRLIGLVVNETPDRAGELLRLHEAELRRRALTGGDAEAYNALAGLVSMARPKDSLETERAGWELFGEERFAAPYLLERAQAKNLHFGDPELAKARAQFPKSSTLSEMAYGLAAEAKAPPAVVLQALMSAIEAEFATLSGGYAPHDSYKLNGYFAALERLNGSPK